MPSKQVELPAEVEMRFDDEFHKRGGWFEQSQPFDCWDAYDTLRGLIKQFIAQELHRATTEAEERGYQRGVKESRLSGFKVEV